VTYNPAATTQLNIVPGLVGIILTMTMLIFTALSVTREIERGTMESLLAMPITPFEIMIGKILPYVIVDFVQASLVIGVGIGLFAVPLEDSLLLLALSSTLSIATNLAGGYTFSTMPQNQLALRIAFRPIRSIHRRAGLGHHERGSAIDSHRVSLVRRARPRWGCLATTG
jgi:ABC-type Na+ efflux pump permease subunit